MSIHIKHPGLLHSKLHIPQGQKIPASRLQSAAHSSSPALRKEADFAINAKHFNHAGHGGQAQASSHASAVSSLMGKEHGK